MRVYPDSPPGVKPQVKPSHEQDPDSDTQACMRVLADLLQGIPRAPNWHETFADPKERLRFFNTANDELRYLSPHTFKEAIPFIHKGILLTQCKTHSEAVDVAAHIYFVAIRSYVLQSRRERAS